MARQFGATWWGKAWVGALEGRASLDPGRLSRGRTYARHDRVARLELGAGRITALVRGSRVLPYQVEIRIPTFTDDQWDRVIGAIAAKAGHAAALLDGELDPGVLDDVRAAGVDLLPGPGDLGPRCSCPDWGDPCKHAASVAYLVADALDEDPFVLFALRGRTRAQVLEAITHHRRGGADAGPTPDSTWIEGAQAVPDPEPATAANAAVDPGMVARDAWSRPLADPPHRRELPTEPGQPAAWPSDPPAGAPFTAAGLTELAADAARRAWHQLGEDAPSHLALPEAADLARRAADRLAEDRPLLDLGLSSTVPAGHLALRAAAWRQAGSEGVAAMEEPLWRPTDRLIDAALDAFDEAGIEAGEVSIRSNRFTSRDVQLRVTSDERWWRYEKRGRTWELVEPPADTPSELLNT